MMLLATISRGQQIASDTISKEQIIYNKARQLADSAKYKPALKELKKPLKKILLNLLTCLKIQSGFV